MDPPVSRFQDEVIRYLDREVLPEISTTYQFYPDCKAKPLGDDRVRVRNLQFLRRNRDGDVELVNDDLSRDQLVFAFHFESVSEWEGWEELLSQFTLTTDCQHLDIPYAVKWESTGTLGRLKADERFDPERTSIRQRIGPREAMRTAIEVLLHDYLPTDLDQLTTSVRIPRLLKRIYDQEAEYIDNLKPADG